VTGGNNHEQETGWIGFSDCINAAGGLQHQPPTKQEIGTATGAVVGGVIGNQVGKD